jgi:hypothetical protein
MSKSTQPGSTFEDPLVVDEGSSNSETTISDFGDGDGGGGGDNGNNGNNGDNDNNNNINFFFVIPGSATPSEPPDGDVEIPETDSGSIYDFLNAVSGPYDGRVDPLVAAELEGIYPSDEFYQALRAADPQRLQYRHLDLFASAAVVAPHERRMNRFAHVWEHNLAQFDVPTYNELQHAGGTLDHLHAIHRWYRRWARWLNQREIVPVNPQNGQSTSSRANLAVTLGDDIVDLRRREQELTSYLDRISFPATWMTNAYDAIITAYGAMRERFRDEGIAGAEAVYNSVPAAYRLVAILASTERLLERMLSRRHVEETRLSHRVFLFRLDEISHMNFSRLYPLRQKYSSFVNAAVRRIQYVANRTYGYRFFKRFYQLRPWKQLYLVVEPANEEEAQAIRDVVDQLNAKNVRTYPLQLRPVNSGEVQGDMCYICRDGFAREQVAIKTWCHHVFHFTCLYSMWDNDVSPGFLCPNCRYICPSVDQHFNTPDPVDRYTTDLVDAMRVRYHEIRHHQRHFPDQPLGHLEKADWWNYYRIRQHRHDTRSFIGVREHIWQPLPVWDLYNNEDLPDEFPDVDYRYDEETDRLVPVDPNVQLPNLTMRLPRKTPVPTRLALQPPTWSTETTTLAPGFLTGGQPKAAGNI